MSSRTEEIKFRCCWRSRFDSFMNGSGICKRRVCCSREVSRIPVKAIKRSLRKRKFRRKVIGNVLHKLPKTSIVYQVMQSAMLRRAVLFGSDEVIRELRNIFTRCKRGVDMTYASESVKKKMIYKNANHRVMCITSKLVNDVETNPGPIVDSTKTICAPYCQGDVAIFGANAGTQCVAMSLLAIVYNFKTPIRSSSQLVEVMHLGNEMYRYISRSAQQQYLMLSEIPQEVCVQDRIYILEYSESYVGNIFHLNQFVLEASNCLPLEEVFDALLRERYNSFLLTITILTVSIFRTTEGCFKVFDSHARNSEGMSDPCGTCVLIELGCIAELVQYFQDVYYGMSDAVFELKGVHVCTNGLSANVETVASDPCVRGDDDDVEMITAEKCDSGGCSCKDCCVVCLYGICFSVIKGIAKWTEQTLEAVVDNAKEMFEKWMLKRHYSMSDIPKTFRIEQAEVKINKNIVYKGVMHDDLSLVSDEVEEVIVANEKTNTGFIMCLSNCYCIACIFQRQGLGKLCYVIFGLDSRNDKGFVYEKLQERHGAVRLLIKLTTEKRRLDTKWYEITFIECRCEMSKKDLQLVIRRHKSANEKRRLAEKQKAKYAAMEPVKKRALLNNRVEKYMKTTANDKRAILNRHGERYRSMGRDEKTNLLKRYAERYASMTGDEKRALLRRHAEQYASMTGDDKRTLLSRQTERYASVTGDDKRALLTRQTERYASMTGDDKRALLRRQTERYASMTGDDKRALLSRQTERYVSMTGDDKRALLSRQTERYASMTGDDKRALLSRQTERYASMTADDKRALLSRQTERYASMTSDEKRALLRRQAERYGTMTPEKKKTLLENYGKKYASMTSDEKRALSIRNALSYKGMDSKKRDVYVRREIRRKQVRRSSEHSLRYYIEKFKSAIREGPYFICVICNRLLYRKTVLEFKQEKYHSICCFVTDVKSFDKNIYICRTCDKKIKNNKMPCQAVDNNLAVDGVPPELAVLEKLEQVLIAQRIVFEKIVVLPKGNQRKIKGVICNVPVSCVETCKELPRAPESSGIIMVKLKRKLQFRGHVYFQAVRQDVMLNALQWLQENNELYRDVSINMDDVNCDVISIGKSEEQEMLNHSGSCNERNNYNDSDDECEREDPQNQLRAGTSETCLQATIPDYPVLCDDVNQSCSKKCRSAGNEIYNIAPGENKHPVSCMTDIRCEELAFPVLFPRGRFGYKADRKIKLSPVKYFNARLLHYTGRFAMNPEYLFFAQFIIEQKKVSDSVSMALKKLSGQTVTASQIRSNDACVRNLIFKDQAYLFLRDVPGSAPYWQKFMFQVMSMVNQLGVPTWFMTLSCADLRWPELFQILSRIRGVNMTDEEVDALSYSEKCSLLNVNPVIVAKHFQYRVETFFRDVLLSSIHPIGKIVYYALRIEFQMRGSPHLHSLIWTADCPELTVDNVEEYTKYIDDHVQGSLPDKQKDAEYFELVRLYQRHTHSRSCRKYKNIPCRFNFGQFFTNETIVSKPLADDISDEQRTILLDKRQEILCTVKEKINEKLDSSKGSYHSSMSAEELLISCNVTRENYEWALSISGDRDFELHLKRSVDSCFVNNYFEAGIKGFKANVDLQPVFNHYKCLTYVCSYFSKDETKCSQAIANAAKEVKRDNLNGKDGLKKVGAAFLTSREVSAQECVYRAMPELWLRKTFPGTVFVSTGLPEERIRIAKCQEELEALDDESTDIYKSNIIERYSQRPRSIEQLCLAEFAAYYYKEYRSNPDDILDDVQPNILSDDLVEAAHDNNCDASLPSKIKLVNSNEVMKCRKVKAVIRFHTPNKDKEPERYFHHLLMLYLPWRKENDLRGCDGTFQGKCQDVSVKEIVDQKRGVFERNVDAINSALQEMSENPTRHLYGTYDSINEQENDDLSAEVRKMMRDGDVDDDISTEQLLPNVQMSQASTSIVTYNQPSDTTDELLRERVRLLNKKQRLAYDIVLSWCRNVVKNMNCLQKEDVKPLHIFISGGGGSGKSHLIRSIYHTAVKVFNYSSNNPDLPKVLLMAPTGVAAVCISASTINSILSIPKDVGMSLPALSDQKKTLLRLTFSEVKLLVIDEISMVSNVRLLHINQRLQEIFGCPSSRMFAGISIIAVGDLYQLPPIQQKPIFSEYSNELYNLSHPWHCFRMIELIKIVRQKNDNVFTDLLNRIRVGEQTEDDIAAVQSRVIDTNNQANYPSNVLHVWAENNPVTKYNNQRLEEIAMPMYVLEAVDQYPKNVTKHDIEKVLSKGRSGTGGLDSVIYIKERARVMLTNNIEICDRLINGQLGTVAKILVDEITHNVKKVYVKFDDEQAGSLAIEKSCDTFAIENKVVPIVRILNGIKINAGKRSSPEIQRLQFPLALSWACTVHKVQGLTLNEIVVSFELFKQKSFNCGQVYVALSRATSLQGLHVLGKLEQKHIRVDRRVCDEYKRLRNECLLEEVTIDLEGDFTLSAVLLNVRSLRRHCIDVRHDRKLFNSDLILLTETQLRPSDFDNDIRESLSPLI